MDKVHQFQVVDIALLKVNFSRNEDNKDMGKNNEEIPLQAQLKWDSSYDDKNKILKTILKASIGDDKSPFKIKTEIGGSFQLKIEPTKKHLEMLRSINCPAILFPYLREYISDLTKRAGFPPLFLPPFNFVAEHKRKKADNNKK